jgi:hypothetical protein
VMPFVWISDAVCGVGVARNTALRISVCCNIGDTGCCADAVLIAV